MNTRKVSSISLPGDLDKRLDLAADDRETTRSRLIREAIEFYLAFDGELVLNTKRLAAGLGVTVGQVMEVLTIARFAQMDAERQVNGFSPSLLHDFMFEDGKLVRGDDLYHRLKARHVAALEARRRVE